MSKQPYAYGRIDTQSSNSPYKSFDPHAVSRASLAPTISRPKQDGPLLSFNQHPDSYFILPIGSDKKQMSPSTKMRVTQTRIVQLVFRCFELLAAIELLVIMIMMLGVDNLSVWLMRIPAGVSMLHSIYGIYHLSRKSSSRPAGSTASYMVFASCGDLTFVAFFAFAALNTAMQYKLIQTSQTSTVDASKLWTSMLTGGSKLIPILVGTAFLCAAIGGGLFLISLALSIYLAVTFRKISLLPPDMNPLEDHLTSRHKRNKSSMSSIYTAEKRIADPLENKRQSGAPYDDLSRPPTIPFLSTRNNQSTSSFSTLQSTNARDSRLDLPSRQYQVLGGGSTNNSARASVVDLRRAPYTAPGTPPKRSTGTYTDIGRSNANSPTAYAHPNQSSSTLRGPNTPTNGVSNLKEAWYTAESLPISARTRARSTSPTKRSQTTYERLPAPTSDDEDDLSTAPSFISESVYSDASAPRHANPLAANPHLPPKDVRAYGNENATGRPLTGGPTPAKNTSPANSCGQQQPANPFVRPRMEASSPRSSTVLREVNNLNSNHGDVGDMFLSHATSQESFTAKPYGALRAGPAPVLVGKGARQVSSGNDVYGGSEGTESVGSFRVFDRREVSGKVAEEGRMRGAPTANASGWGTRFRKMSGQGR